MPETKMCPNGKKNHRNGGGVEETEGRVQVRVLCKAYILLLWQPYVMCMVVWLCMRWLPWLHWSRMDNVVPKLLSLYYYLSLYAGIYTYWHDIAWFLVFNTANLISIDRWPRHMITFMINWMRSMMSCGATLQLFWNNLNNCLMIHLMLNVFLQNFSW